MPVGHPTNGYIILGILQGHAPDSEAQAFLTRWYNDTCRQIQADYEVNHNLEVEKVMAVALSDGLQYGNWPWIIGQSCSSNPFSVNDRVREASDSPKVDGIGTVINIDGPAVTVKWDKENSAPSYGHARLFVLVK